MKLPAHLFIEALSQAIAAQDAKDKAETGPLYTSPQVAYWETAREAARCGLPVEISFPEPAEDGSRVTLRTAPTAPLPKPLHLKMAMEWWDSFSPLIQQRYIFEYGYPNFVSADSIARFWSLQFPKTANGTDFT